MLDSRDELIFLLTEAAELEHSICCMYLFAALSLKRDTSEGVTPEELIRVGDWEQTLLLIARQEMEHLGLVCNLLSALGAAPHFDKPDFPQPAKYYPIRLTLEPFNEATVKRFLCIERPDTITPQDAFCCEESVTEGCKTALEAFPGPVPFRTVGELYEIIRGGFENLKMDDRDLFIGPSTAQVGGMALQYLYPKSIAFIPGVFDVYMFPITDRASAVKAVNLIIEQGEGANPVAPVAPSANSSPSHYERFLQMLSDYQTLAAEAEKQGRTFQPARRVVSNPYLYAHLDTPEGSPITAPDTRAVLSLFNSAYETMLLLLIRFFAHTDETPQEIDGLLYTFYPLMTMAIRPLAEILTQMPAASNDSTWNAGPSFETNNTLHLLPHKRSAWLLLHDKLANLARDCHTLTLRPGLSPRLAFIAQNLEYIEKKFAALVAAQS